MFGPVSTTSSAAQITQPSMMDEQVGELVKQNIALLKRHISGGDSVDFKTIVFQLREHQPEVFAQLGTTPFDDEDGITLFHLAAEMGDSEVMDVLSTCYPEAVNQPDAAGDTPLMYAARKNNATLLERMLTPNADVPAAEQADVNGKNGDGWTALMWAAFSGAVNALKTLLGYEQASTVVDDTKAVVSASIRPIQIDAVNKRGNSAFLIALEAGHLEIAMLLRNAGGSTDIRNAEGKNALMVAIGGGLTVDAIVDQLELPITSDVLAQTDSRGYDGWRNVICDSPTATRDRNVERLVDLKVDVNVKLENGKTPMMLAIEAKHSSIVRVLLKAPGIKLEEKDDEGRTALLHGVKEGEWESVKDLIAADATYFVSDRAGKGVKDYADERNEWSKFEELLSST